MKGAILSRALAIRIVDVTHEIPRHEVAVAAFQLLAAHSAFPPGTVHLAVVDPGVGSARRPIAVAAAGHLFVGPDNGIFDLILDHSPSAEVRELSHPDLRAERVSHTFHGRDVFAPAAAALATGFPFDRVGPLVEEPVRSRRRPRHAPEAGKIGGEILHVDHFGNCVTSLREADLPGGLSAYSVDVGGARIDQTRTSYSGATGADPFLILGSAGFIEISVDRGSAAAALGAARGDLILASQKISGDGRSSRSSDAGDNLDPPRGGQPP